MDAMNPSNRKRLSGLWILLLFPLLGIIMAVVTVTGLPNFSKPIASTPIMLGIGQPAPAFSAATLDGSKVSLSDLKGSIVAISFWATWCEPCKAEMPALQSAADQYRSQNLKILAVDDGETADVIRPFVSGLKLSLPIVLDPDKTIIGQYQVLVLPVTVWVDRQGLVRFEHIGALDGPLIDSYMVKLSALK